MNRFLYSLALFIGIPFAIFRLLIKDTHDASWTRKLKNQFGIVEKIPGRVIWTHCVSVGEFNASKPLIKKLMSQYPITRLLFQLQQLQVLMQSIITIKITLNTVFFLLIFPLY